MFRNPFFKHIKSEYLFELFLAVKHSSLKKNKNKKWNQATLIKLLTENNIPVTDDAPHCCEQGHFEIPFSVAVKMRV